MAVATMTKVTKMAPERMIQGNRSLTKEFWRAAFSLKVGEQVQYPGKGVSYLRLGAMILGSVNNGRYTVFTDKGVAYMGRKA